MQLLRQLDTGSRANVRSASKTVHAGPDDRVVISEIICEWPKAICEWKGFSYDGNALSRLFGAKKSSWHPR
jgi:hypothetical protein